MHYYEPDYSGGGGSGMKGMISSNATPTNSSVGPTTYLQKLTRTDYMAGGYQYKDEVIEFIPHAEGFIKNEKGSYVYYFNHKDHLGNVRVTYTDDGSGTPYVVEESNYYPFGLKHKGYNEPEQNMKDWGNILTMESSLNHKYKYNGKEFQDELGLGMYTYGFRDYDPAIGRWNVIDPLAEKYRRWSPYNYCINNPIRFVDPDGRAIINVEGGVSFTGEDAKTMFKALQKQVKETGGIKGFHFVMESKTKHIYNDLLSAFRAGKPNVLHIIKDNPALKNSNRNNAIGSYPVRKKEGLERQEYPYASTYEGGKGAYVTYVPEGEQRIEGGQLSALSRTLKDKDAFIVVPVPKDKEPDAIPEQSPMPVAAPSSFMDKMSKVTGLTGTGLIIYLVISEGSRLFPPRNLLPIP